MPYDNQEFQTSYRGVNLDASVTTKESSIGSSDSSFTDDCVYSSEGISQSLGELPRVRAYDVAVYILNKLGSCTSMKLHKLLYFCQAWSLVWDEKPLFSEEIEAWANGPVIKDLFAYHRGLYVVTSADFPTGNPNLLNDAQKETIDAVLEFYGNKSAQYLINLTHSERPWIDARKGLEPMERGNKVITLDAMANYYSSLQ